MKATHEGRNAYANLGGTVPLADNGLSLRDHDAVAVKIRAVKEGDLYFTGLQPLLLHWRNDTPNFLDMQTYFKVCRVRAEFDLLRGEPSAALGRLVPNLAPCLPHDRRTLQHDRLPDRHRLLRHHHPWHGVRLSRRFRVRGGHPRQLAVARSALQASRWQIGEPPRFPHHHRRRIPISQQRFPELLR